MKMTLDLGAIEAKYKVGSLIPVNDPKEIRFEEINLIKELCSELRSSRSDCERLGDEVRRSREETVALTESVRRAREIIDKKHEALVFLMSDWGRRSYFPHPHDFIYEALALRLEKE